jgi:hypothetical protein
MFAPDGSLWVMTGTVAQHKLQILDRTTGVLGPVMGDSFAPFEGLLPAPDGKRTYGGGRDLERLDPPARQVFPPRRFETALYGLACFPVGFLDPGPAHLATTCGVVVQVSASVADDLVYAGAFEGTRAVGSVVVLPDGRVLALGEPRHEMRVFAPPLWTITRRFELLPLGVADKRSRAQPIFAFLGTSSPRVHVVLDDDTTRYPDRPSPHAVVSFDP